jgi:hypothetical protein
MERQNPSSYAKTRPVLKTASELEDKTGTIRTKLVTTSMDRCNGDDKCNRMNGMD